MRLCLYMLALVFGMPVSKGKVNRSLDFCLIAKETTGDCKQGFVYLRKLNKFALGLIQ